MTQPIRSTLVTAMLAGFAMSAQAAPRCRTSSRSRASSAGVHLSFRIEGLSLWRQRWAHCWPVRPGMRLATEDQLSERFGARGGEARR